MSFTVSAAKGLSSVSKRAPTTNAKGKSTRLSLCPKDIDEEALFELDEDTNSPFVPSDAPFFFLLHEYTTAGLYLEFSRPSLMEESGIITEWGERIPIPFLSATGDLSPFDEEPDDDFDVPVEPL
jgi:hypothetical protein